MKRKKEKEDKGEEEGSLVLMVSLPIVVTVAMAVV